MGLVRVNVSLGSPDKSKIKSVRFLVDTGSWYMVITPEVAKELELKNIGKTKVMLADKRQVEVDVSAAYVGLVGREAILTVAVMDTPEPLLGASTLEALGLSVNPKTGELEPIGPTLLMV